MSLCARPRRQPCARVYARGVLAVVLGAGCGASVRAPAPASAPASPRSTTAPRAGAASFRSDGPSFTPVITPDGRFVVFASAASNLVPGDSHHQTNVFWRDLTGGPIVRVSVGLSGPADGASDQPSISADGRFVAFRSNASNLVRDDTNRRYDVFVRDLRTGTTTRASVAHGADPNPDEESFGPRISADGRFVAFGSSATNLVPGDRPGTDVFVRDLGAGTTLRASVAQGVDPNTDGFSGWPDISADGRYVMFVSEATNLVPGPALRGYGYFVRDMRDGTTARARIETGFADDFRGRFSPVALSADGRRAAFHAMSGRGDAYVLDLAAGTTTRVSVPSGTDGSAGGGSFDPAISADGRFVVFASPGADLVPGDTNGHIDIFLRDMQSHTTTRVSVAAGDDPNANGDSLGASVSVDGRYVAFSSRASDLVPDDTNGQDDIFVRDARTGTTSLVTIGAGPAGAAAP